MIAKTIRIVRQSIAGSVDVTAQKRLRQRNAKHRRSVSKLRKANADATMIAEDKKPRRARKRPGVMKRPHDNPRKMRPEGINPETGKLDANQIAIGREEMNGHKEKLRKRHGAEKTIIGKVRGINKQKSSVDVKVSNGNETPVLPPKDAATRLRDKAAGLGTATISGTGIEMMRGGMIADNRMGTTDRKVAMINAAIRKDGRPAIGSVMKISKDWHSSVQFRFSSNAEVRNTDSSRITGNAFAEISNACRTGESTTI